jgi:hypothetical protein
MNPLSEAQFVALLGLDKQHWRRTFGGRFPLAWGVPAEAARELFAIDAVGGVIAFELATAVGVFDAAGIVEAFADHWMETTGRAAHDPEGRTYYLGVGIAGPPHKREYLIASGTAEELLGDVHRHGFEPRRVITVNITGIIRELRARAKRMGLDLGLIFLPPSDPRFAELIGEAADLRRQAFEALKRANPKKFDRPALPARALQ